MLFVLSSARLSEQTPITFSMIDWKYMTRVLGSKDCDQQSELQWLAQEPITNSVLQRLVQEPVLFNIFINNLDDETKSWANNWNPGVVNDWGGPWQGGEMGQQESNGASQREEQRSCPWGGITSCASGYWGLTHWNAALEKTAWLSWCWMCQTQCALAHKTQTASWIAGGSALPLGWGCSFHSTWCK